jgi:cephalosporin hydroxylase
MSMAPLFDLFLDDVPAAAAGAQFSARLECPTCGQDSTIRIWNRRWNDFRCSHCRFPARQYIHACPATLDPLNRRIANVAVSQYQIDWRAFGPMGQCLGPREERRVMLAFQFAGRGLTGSRLTVRYSARRVDTGRVIATWEDDWLPCRCSDGTCRHNRLVHWLPPGDVWDQETLDCEVRVTTGRGDLLFEDRIRCDIAPPELGQPSAVAAVTSTPTEEPKAEVVQSSSEADIVDRFHHLYYYGSEDEHQVWVRTFWMNVPCIQCPLDLWVYQEILTELRPDLVVETGTLLGGTTLFLAQTLDAVGKGTIVSIDLEDLPRPAHPRIGYVSGSSTDATLIAKLFAARPPEEKRVVILDSDHSKAHVLGEMRLFAPHVPVGGYMIVTDSNVNGHPVFPAYGPGPYEAIEEFLTECDEFVIDFTRQKHKLTFNPNGFLKRIKPRPAPEAAEMAS